MYGSDLGTWQGCLVAHSAGLTPVPSHHSFLNWWAEGQWQICAYSCWSCRCSLGLVSDIAMLVSSLQRHLEESERIQAGCPWSSWQICRLQWAAEQLLGGFHLPSITRHSSSGIVAKRPFHMGIFPLPSKSCPLRSYQCFSPGIPSHTALTWPVLKTMGGENQRELLPVHFVWLPESLFAQQCPRWAGIAALRDCLSVTTRHCSTIRHLLMRPKLFSFRKWNQA